MLSVTYHRVEMHQLLVEEGELEVVQLDTICQLH